MRRGNKCKIANIYCGAADLAIAFSGSGGAAGVAGKWAMANVIATSVATIPHRYPNMLRKLCGWPVGL